VTNHRQQILSICDDSRRSAEEKINDIKYFANEMAAKNHQRGFSVSCRDEGHFDIYGDKGREFRIRGEHGKFSVSDERRENRAFEGWQEFKSLQAAFMFVADFYISF
jgi:hypothetical protein